VKRKVVWTSSVGELFLALPNQDRDGILERLDLVELFPYMYPVRTQSKRFRRHRWFCAGEWLVYYRVVDNIVYVRGLWPARIP
jgi:hypothetical protein